MSKAVKSLVFASFAAFKPLLLHLVPSTCVTTTQRRWNKYFLAVIEFGQIRCCSRSSERPSAREMKLIRSIIFVEIQRSVTYFFIPSENIAPPGNFGDRYRIQSVFRAFKKDAMAFALGATTDEAVDAWTTTVVYKTGVVPCVWGAMLIFLFLFSPDCYPGPQRFGAEREGSKVYNEYILVLNPFFNASFLSQFNFLPYFPPCDQERLCVLEHKCENGKTDEPSLSSGKTLVVGDIRSGTYIRISMPETGSIGRLPVFRGRG